jgi:hypothetical protein
LSWTVYGTIFRITPGSGASFTEKGAFLKCRNKLFEEVTGRILKSVFKEASKT